MAGSAEGTIYHRSPACKRFVAEKIDRLSRLDFLRTPPEQWTDEQRARYQQWLPSADELAAEMLADRRFLTRLASP